MKRGRPVLNIVVSNPTNQSYVLRKGVVLGSVEAVSAVIPLMPKKMKGEARKAGVHQVSFAPGSNGDVDSSGSVGDDDGTNKTNSGSSGWLPKVDLSHLVGEQRLMAEAMLREECEAFSQDENDHGDAPDLEMDIKTVG